MDGNRIREILAQNIRVSRKRLYYIQSDLAERVGVSTIFIGEIEICRKFPSLANIEGIAAASGMKPFQLFVNPEDAGMEKTYKICYLESGKNLKNLLTLISM